MMNTFQKAGFILAVIVMVSAGCRNSTTNQTTDSFRDMNATDTSMVNGPWEEYHDSLLVARGSYKHGKKAGNWTYWYPNEQISAEGHFHKGEKDGMWVQWYKDGEVMWKGVYDMGKRKINPHKAEPGVEFLDAQPDGRVLNADTVYVMQIRIPNVPPELLYVEVSSGSISRNQEPDQFLYKPSSDSSMTLLIGYYPDESFKDFRNLAAEMEFRIIN